MGRTRWLVRTCTLGLAFGAADSFVNALSSPYQRPGAAIAGTAWARVAEVASLLLDAGWAWAALAVAAGWAAVVLVRALMAGPLTLATAVIAYFCSDAVLRAQPVSATEMLVWGVASLLLGPALGAIGQQIRQRSLRGALAGLVVPAGAALQMVLEPPGLARLPSGWVPNPEADLARALVLGLAAAMTVIILCRLAVHVRARTPRDGVDSHLST